MIDPAVGRNTQFSASSQPNNNGRKPSKLRKYIKDNNLSSLDIGYLVKECFRKDEDELFELITDKSKPIIVRLFAKALITDLAKGTLNNAVTLINRAFGNPVQPIENNNNFDRLLLMTVQERDKILDDFVIQRENQKVRESADSAPPALPEKTDP